MLPKTYDPKPVEEKYTKLWQEKGIFLSTVPEDKAKKSFVIVIPPPNITGALHMGHALNNTLQDSLIRSRRMFGREAYWVPGTDHGGIATQNVMEKRISASRKLHRHDLGREKFLEETWQWYGECGATILNQLNRLGCSLDLSREHVRFTMDEKRATSVFEAFRLLWEKGYIYRGGRMINWCVRCGTALSDAEVDHEEHKGKLWHYHYPLEDGSKGITIATTRPETMLGDTAVAVNPKDERYKHLVGKKLRLPLTDRTIPVIADDMVDMSFGTGAVKITPAHDPADYDMGQRHKLETIKVISFEGKMINVPAPYLGLDRTAARHKVVEDLKAAGLFEKEEHYMHAVSSCERCGQPIEPLVSEQWFVKMKPMAEAASKAINDNRITFHPDNWRKPLLDWLDNIQDWCISRQIWWGHRMPIWYCEECSGKGLVFQTSKQGVRELARVSVEHGAKPIFSREKPAKCPLCGGTHLVQDPDVLDTWFSSGLWPFSVFNWPEKTKELDYYYPTSVLSTGYEILYLWVARMIMMGLEFMGDVPFTDVYLHGIVRDKHGQKMSKSKGNVVDPLDLMAKYGTDAVRFSLVLQAIPGKDIPFAEESITGSRNFCNKIYNASRFLHMHVGENAGWKMKKPGKPVELCDRWIMDRYGRMLSEARKALEEYDVARAADAIYHFLWDDYCDWYVELCKPRLQDPAQKDEALSRLFFIMHGTLKALHPFMPFITDEIVESFKPYIPDCREFLVLESYPQPDPSHRDDAAVRDMETVMGVTSAIRKMRAHFNVPPGLQIKAVLSAGSEGALGAVRNQEGYIKLLAKVDNLSTGVNMAKPPQAVTTAHGALSIFIPLEGIVDFAKELPRLNKELEKLRLDLASCDARMKDERFMKNAPAAEVKKITDRREETARKIELLESATSDLAA